ncbi:hypothetical protein NE237_002342 [Protea cynaroides]|uniref:ADP-ribosyl cyclase/cyclic ADP-ribose hydrolase n=1 Tax=Protea cynaroides TaxID=273540 RepID=A0A9Q0KVP9_9MAGN|nr:hypothetical protein NE237_002342 [Protea cynaroides]
MAELTESSSVSSSGSPDFNNFISLYKALKNSGINVFMDSEKLWTGEVIDPSLLRAIEGSKISLPVFSKDYASSKWRLVELLEILHCHRSNGQMILLIFLDVDPSHVQNKTGSFQGEFQNHEMNFESHIVKSWREALREVGNLKRWVLKEIVNGVPT